MPVNRFTNNYGVKPSLRNFTNILRSFTQALARKIFKIYPAMPFIPFSATKRLKTILKPDFKILEIGAGMSTVWMAKRCKEITSIEAGESWVTLLKSIFAKEKIANVNLIHQSHGPSMADFDAYEDKYFDLIFVDGGPRESCCINALEKVKPGGYIYLDNSDSELLCGNGRNILLKNAVSKEFFVDFVPGYVAVNEGLLIQMP